MSAETLKKEFIPKYISDGKQKFYRFILIYALNKMVLINNGSYKGSLPDLELLDYYERFLTLYRREGDSIYLQIAGLFRKAAHRIHRLMIKKQMSSNSIKFLRSV